MDAVADNVATFNAIYSTKRSFLRYPADWVVRFHAHWLRANIPEGRVLDFGCGSGNNLAFFQNQGYETVATEVAPAVLPLIEENAPGARVHILEPCPARLPFPDGSFDVAVANQVLYFLADRNRIRHIAAELARVLRPGGVLFATMMGPRNYWITDHGREIAPDTYAIHLDSARLGHRRDVVYIARDEDHLRSLFPGLRPLTVGWFEQAMFELKSNFHWIYVGRA